MGLFDDNTPVGFKRSAKGWLKTKPDVAKKQIKELKSENEDLKLRLEQLEAAVSELATKKKK